MTSWEACRRVLYLGEKQGNENKPPGSSSSSTLEKKKKKMTMNHNARCHLLHLRKKPRDIISIHFSAAKESQINVDYCGYTMGCLQ
jgi:hypothetical protein